MARLGKLLKVVLFNVVLMLILMELVALTGYYFKTGKLYYIEPPSGRSVAVDLGQTVEGYRIHPYYGFTVRPQAKPPVGGYALGANNHGFDAASDYPVEKLPGDFLVGIFGGSVAAKLAVFEHQHGILAEKINSALEGSQAKVLSFAQGGFKQPQQLLLLNYFRALGQELDLVINVDGFNEVALAGHNAESGIAVDMPSIDHVMALQDVTSITTSAGGIERMLRIRGHWRKHARFFNRAWSGEAWELTFASGFMVDWLIYEYHLRRYHATRLEYAGSANPAERASWFHLRSADAISGEDAAAAMRRGADVWARSSVLMSQTQKARGALYLHFIQPNQYFPTQRRYSEEERSVAFSAQSRYPPFVELGYPYLQQRVDSLLREEVSAWSLLELFDDVPEPVYIDNCCHYTDVGQRILVETIGDVAAQEISEHSHGHRPPESRHIN